MATWQEELSGPLWRNIFYSQFTIVRTAILMPILALYMVLLMRLVSTRGDNQSSLFNRVGTYALGAFIVTAPLRASTPLATALVGITLFCSINLLLNALYYYGVLPKHSLSPKPILLVAQGRMLHSQMRKVFMTPDKVQSQLRQHGYASLEAVFAAVMEPNGYCSVIPYGPNGSTPANTSLLEPIDGYAQFLGKQHDAHHSNMSAAAPAGEHV